MTWLKFQRLIHCHGLFRFGGGGLKGPNVDKVFGGRLKTVDTTEDLETSRPPNKGADSRTFQAHGVGTQYTTNYGLRPTPASAL